MSVSTRSPPVRVSALRTLSLVLALAAAVGLIFGTAGFTAMEADRGVTANITDDENAYLGYAPATDAVNDALQALTDNGTLAEITDTWLGADQSAPVLQ